MSLDPRWRAALLASLLLPACAGPDPDGVDRSASAAQAASETAPPGEHEAFLLGWARGEQPSLLFASWIRDFPESPHRGPSEDFEAAVHAFHARSLSPESRARLVEGLRTVLAGSDLRAQARALTVLGRLGAVEALEDIIGVAEDGWDRARLAAIDALGWFGERRRTESFLVYGGGLRILVSPTAPDLRARESLMRVLRSPPEFGGTRGSSEETWKEAAMDAAVWHRSTDLDADPEISRKREALQIDLDRAPGIYRSR